MTLAKKEDGPLVVMINEPVRYRPSPFRARARGCLTVEAAREPTPGGLARTGVSSDCLPHGLTFALLPLQPLQICFRCALGDPHLVAHRAQILPPAQWLDKVRDDNKAGRHEREKREGVSGWGKRPAKTV
jgi:hypothetical protein